MSYLFIKLLIIWWIQISQFNTLNKKESMLIFFFNSINDLKWKSIQAKMNYCNLFVKRTQPCAVVDPAGRSGNRWGIRRARAGVHVEKSGRIWVLHVTSNGWLLLKEESKAHALYAVLVYSMIASNTRCL